MNKLRFVTEAFIEFVDLTSRVKNLLFASIKWMALRADINSHIVFAIGRTSSECIAAAAFYVYVVIFWMNISFHVDFARIASKALNSHLVYWLLWLKKQGVNSTCKCLPNQAHYGQVLIMAAC